MDPRRGVPYLPGVDGLRALAVIAVFVHHAHAAWLSGGYLGVDLFFVISGFVITRGLLAEWDRARRVDVRDFWRRRARRLLPAAYVLILATLAAYELWFAADVRALAQLALAAAAYVANWHLILRDAPYFESIGPPSPLQHLWSLAVEEQFYLVWPLLLAALLRVRGRPLVAAACIMLAAASSAWTWQLSAGGASEARLYYGSDTHATGLLLGATLACLPASALALRRGLLADGVAVGALAGLGALAWWLAAWRLQLYPWAFALTGLLGAAAIAAAAHPTARAARVLGCAPLRWLGLRSYSVYLWHWPVIVVSRRAFAEPPHDLVLLAMQCAATLALTELSYRCVESPLRTGALGRWRQRLAQRAAWRARAGSLAGAAAAAALVLLVVARATLAPPATPPPYLATAALAGVLTAPPPAALGEAVVTPDELAARLQPAPGVAVAAPAAPPAFAAPTVPPDANALPHDSTAALGTPAASPAAVSSSSAVLASASVAAPALAGVPATGAPVFAVGDSVMLGAAQALARAFGAIDLDAAAGRDARSVVAIVRQRRDSGTLPALVIVHTGDNGLLTRAQLDELLQAATGASLVLLINLRVPQPWERPNNALLADALLRHGRARLVDWHGVSADQPDWFWSDGMHLRPAGADAFAALICAAAGLPPP